MGLVTYDRGDLATITYIVSQLSGQPAPTTITVRVLAPGALAPTVYGWPAPGTDGTLTAASGNPSTAGGQDSYSYSVDMTVGVSGDWSVRGESTGAQDVTEDFFRVLASAFP